MTITEIISGLKFTIEMFLFDPNTGEKLTEPRNDMDKITLDACKGAIKALEQLEQLEQQQRDCNTCKHSDNGNCAYTEECHECMWKSKYEKQPCDDCISREAVDEYITNLLSGYLYDEERTRLEDLSAYIWELPSVTPKTESKNVFDKIRAEIEEERKGYPPSADEYKTINKVLQILDKYKSESEGNA